MQSQDSELMDKTMELFSSGIFAEVVNRMTSVEVDQILADGEVSKGTKSELEKEFANEIDVLKDIHKCLSSWKASSSSGATFWNILAEVGISPRALSVILLCLIKSKQAYSFAAAAAYLALVAIPGNASVFNSVIVRSAMGLIAQWAKVVTDQQIRDSVGKKAKNKNSFSSVEEKKNTRASNNNNNNNDVDDDVDMMDTEDDKNPFDEGERSKQMKKLILTDVQLVQTALKQVTCVLKTGIMSKHPDVLNHCVESLVLVTHTQDSKDQVPSSLAYAALHTVVGETGHQRIYSTVLKAVLPTVLMTHYPLLSSTLPKGCSYSRNAAINFIISSAQTDPSTRYSPVLYLLQHMCVRSPDRAQYRKQLASTMIQFVSELPALLTPLVAFLVKLSRNSKAPFRGLSVEISAGLLSKADLFVNVPSFQDAVNRANYNNHNNNNSGAKDDMLSSSFSINEEGENMEAKAPAPLNDKEEELDQDMKAEEEKDEKNDQLDEKNMQLIRDPEDTSSCGQTLFEILVNRCCDRSPTVRARALNALAAAITLANDSTVLQRQFANLLRDRNVSTLSTSPPPSSLSTALSHSSSSLSSSSEIPQTPAAAGASNHHNNSAMGTPFTPFNASSSNNTSLHTPSAFVNHSINNPNASGVPQSPLHPQNDGIREILSLLHRRAADSKPVVRKAAVQALTAFLESSGCDSSLICMEDLQVFFDGCMDSSLSIRKQSLQSLSSLLQHHTTSPVIQKVWLGAALPLVLDRESSVQEKTDHYLRELLFLPITTSIQEASNRRVTPPEHDYAWQMMRVLDEDMISYLRAAVCRMIKQKTLPSNLLDALNSFAQFSNEPGCWLLLEMISEKAPESIDSSAVLASWDKLISGTHVSQLDSVALNHYVRVLETVGHIACELSSNVLAGVAHYLFNSLKGINQTSSSSPASSTQLVERKVNDSFVDAKNDVEPDDSTPPTLIKAYVNAMKDVTDALDNVQQEETEPSQRKELPPWERELMSACEQVLSHFVMNPSARQKKLVPSLFMAGELALNTDAKVTSTMLTLVQSLLPPYLAGSSSSASSSSSSSSSSSYSSKIKIGAHARAHAFVALGKMCLRNQVLAKQCAPVLVRELEDGNCPIIRNNVLVIMCDLARTYTTIVDRYMPVLTAALKDSKQVIRRHTLMIISQLLMEDYIKWKGSMFFRYLVTIVDDAPLVRDFALQSLTSIVTTKNTSLLHNHFIETILYVNNCLDLPFLNNRFSIANRTSASSSKDDGVGGSNSRNERRFALLGATNASKRFTIYKYLLSHMNDQQKFACTAKICQDIFGAVNNGTMPLDDTTQDVLKDALLILAHPAIKLNTRSEVDEDPDISELQAEKMKKMAAARGKLLSKLVKKNTMENVVPILIELKRKLEKRQSSLLRYLMLYLQVLLVDYKDELEDILAADPQLATELTYDLRQFAKQQTIQKTRFEQRRLSLTPVSKGALKQAGRRLSMSATKHGIMLDAMSPGSGRARHRRRSSFGLVSPAPQFGTPRLRRSKSMSSSSSSSMASPSMTSPSMLPPPPGTPRSARSGNRPAAPSFFATPTARRAKSVPLSELSSTPSSSSISCSSSSPPSSSSSSSSSATSFSPSTPNAMELSSPSSTNDENNPGLINSPNLISPVVETNGKRKKADVCLPSPFQEEAPASKKSKKWDVSVELDADGQRIADSHIALDLVTTLKEADFPTFPSSSSSSLMSSSSSSGSKQPSPRGPFQSPPQLTSSAKRSKRAKKRAALAKNQTTLTTAPPSFE